MNAEPANVDTTEQRSISGMSATYSPEDNKLRLYSVSRLDGDTYQRVKAAGFKWAPRQSLFVAPMWTPDRVDLLEELCGGVGDEDTSLVDRAEERADRFDTYSVKRAADGEAAHKYVRSIADHIPFGQPILVGHHSERHARKDAQRIENGMRKAVKMWETSTYWTQRAKGALAHAKYKERPDVRVRRIKTIEADMRAMQRNKDEATKWLKAWSLEGLTLEQAVTIANVCNLDVPRKDGDNPTLDHKPSAWVVLTNYYPNLYVSRTLEEVVDAAKTTYPKSIAWADRWISHYENRLAYERAMLEEQGGLVATRFTIEVGGQVLVDGKWLNVLRVNKSRGVVSSVTTDARFMRKRSIEEVKDYIAPTAERAAVVKAATKLPPLVNYPGEGFAHITAAKWEAISKEYRGTNTVEKTDTIARHRVRSALGCFVLKDEKDSNKRHSYPCVYITDLPIKTPTNNDSEPTAAPLPATEKTAPPSATVVQAATSDIRIVPHVDAAALKRAREQLRAGVQVVSAHQLFPTPALLAARMVALAGLRPGARVLEPHCGTMRILRAVLATNIEVSLVAVEINARLCSAVQSMYPHVVTHCTDFLDFVDIYSDGFDCIIMNPPFENGVDIEHIQHALPMLRPGGRLVSVCANGPRQSAALQPVIEGNGGLWEVLPADSFKESGTSVNAVLLTYTA